MTVCKLTVWNAIRKKKKCIQQARKLDGCKMQDIGVARKDAAR